MGPVRTAVRTAGGTLPGASLPPIGGLCVGEGLGLGAPSQASCWRQCFSDGDRRLQV